MYHNKTIAVVIPAYNEEKMIAKAIAMVPSIADYIVVVNDGSTDKTAQVVTDLGGITLPSPDTLIASEVGGDSAASAEFITKILLINHLKNSGCGSAIISGYTWCRANKIDITVNMDGDAQMDGGDFPSIIEPVASGLADFSKGNRLSTGEALKSMPKIRYFGNNVLSLLTKIASGYWHIADSQCGYTAIGARALAEIPFDRLYPTYGYPNHILVMLNVYNCKVLNTPIKPIYGQGEQSKIRIWNVIPKISLLLLRLFFWRIQEKYVVRDFHPLVFFYGLSIMLFLGSIFFAVRLAWLWPSLGYAPPMTAFSLGFCIVTCLQTAFFAMWFDMDSNKSLR